MGYFLVVKFVEVGSSQVFFIDTHLVIDIVWDSSNVFHCVTELSTDVIDIQKCSQ